VGIDEEVVPMADLIMIAAVPTLVAWAATSLAEPAQNALSSLVTLLRDRFRHDDVARAIIEARDGAVANSCLWLGHTYADSPPRPPSRPPLAPSASDRGLSGRSVVRFDISMARLSDASSC